MFLTPHCFFFFFSFLELENNFMLDAISFKANFELISQKFQTQSLIGPDSLYNLSAIFKILLDFTVKILIFVSTISKRCTLRRSKTWCWCWQAQLAYSWLVRRWNCRFVDETDTQNFKQSYPCRSFQSKTIYLILGSQYIFD